MQSDGSTIEDDHTFGAQSKDISYGYSFSGGTDSVVIDAGASCSALVPSGSADSVGWNQFAAPATTGWTFGTTGVGYEAGFEPEFNYQSSIGLDVSSMYQTNASVYIRVPFTISDVTQISQLTLRMKYDDGFIAYINGEKVTESNAPLTPFWHSEATDNHQDEDAVIYQDYDINSTTTLRTKSFKASQDEPAVLTWPAQTGRVYSVYWTDDLSQPFQMIATGLQVGSYTDAAHSSNTTGFYRIQVKMK